MRFLPSAAAVTLALALIFALAVAVPTLACDSLSAARDGIDGVVYPCLATNALTQDVKACIAARASEFKRGLSAAPPDCLSAEKEANQAGYIAAHCAVTLQPSGVEGNTDARTSPPETSTTARAASVATTQSAQTQAPQTISIQAFETRQTLVMQQASQTLPTEAQTTSTGSTDNAPEPPRTTDTAPSLATTPVAEVTVPSMMAPAVEVNAAALRLRVPVPPNAAAPGLGMIVRQGSCGGYTGCAWICCAIFSLHPSSSSCREICG